MCGIWALFGSDGDVALQSMAAHKIRHRGPDGFRIETINFFPNCCLAFHRLTINDELRGMQPMRNFKYPHLWLIYNGEIYNHKRLKDQFNFDCSTSCDGESILHLFVKGGIEFTVKHLDGVFAFCLLDTAERKVYLGRDTFGVKPMIRSYTNEGFLALCSEAKGIIDLLNEDESELKQFPPGCVETYDIDLKGKATFIERHKFHKIGNVPFHSTDIELNEDIKGNIRTLLEAAVNKRLMSDRRVGCMISGGLDSSLVAAITVKKAKQMELPYRIQTFAIGMKGSSDLKAARKVAAYLDTEHHEIVFTLEEAFAAIGDVIYHMEIYDTYPLRVAICSYLLCKYVKNNTDTTVLLSGEGSDEIAHGYVFFHAAPTAEASDEESRRLCENLHLFDILRTDRTAAAWGLEIRVPFLDHKFSSYYLALNADLKVPKNGVEKHLLRTAFDGQHLLPDDILWRPKAPFSEGVSPQKRNWNRLLRDLVNNQVEERELTDAQTRYKINIPHSKEALYYRRIFETFFPGKACTSLVPFYWTQKWTPSLYP